ncbi:MAG: class I SAM-dependent methyltransferase [Bacteroidia bacterium]|nr:class I SAM-dependent methyltransferase [Bacteroidia bacterium]
MIVKNSYGFFVIENKPSKQELGNYYKKKYFQSDKGNYEKKYTDEELKFLRNKLEEKLFVVTQQLGIKDNVSFLDIGAGEGWAMSFFQEKGWSVVGLDYSEFGCKNHNSHLIRELIVGDIYKSIKTLIRKNKKFDVILLDNVLEHVIDPFSLLEDCKKLANKSACLIIEVPNDFSILQSFLFEKKIIDNQFWIALPDHLSYFNKEGLNNICKDAGWENVLSIADYPIDLHLLNENTNYSKDKSKGKSCHLSRIATDNLLHSISTERTVALYKAYADLGLGRQIIGFFI